jgi:outer membrane immunogenic protein
MKLLLGVLSFAVVFTTCCASAQSSRTAIWPITYDLEGGISVVHANAGPGTCGCFYMFGGNAQFVVNRRHGGWGRVVDFATSSANNINSSTHNISLSTYMGGLRYNLRPRKGVFPFTEAMAGVGRTSTNFAIDDKSTALAYAAGGGVELNISRRFELRLIEADFLSTHVPNQVNDRQNQLRLTAGLVFHLNRPGF